MCRHNVSVLAGSSDISKANDFASRVVLLYTIVPLYPSSDPPLEIPVWAGSGEGDLLRFRVLALFPTGSLTGITNVTGRGAGVGERGSSCLCRSVLNSSRPSGEKVCLVHLDSLEPVSKSRVSVSEKLGLHTLRGARNARVA